MTGKPAKVLAAVLFAAAALFVVTQYVQFLTDEKPKLDEVRTFREVLASILNDANIVGFPGNAIASINGEKLYSWRFESHLILDPVTDRVGLPVAAGHDWRSEPQRQITHAGYGKSFRNGKSVYATIFAFEGNDSAFVERQSENAALGFEERRKLDEVPKELILIVQVRQAQIEWNQPGDCKIVDLLKAEDSLTIKDYSIFGGPILLGFADASIWKVRESLPINVLSRFAAISTARHADREKEIGPYVISRE